MLPALSYGDGFVAYFGSFLVGEAVKGVDVAVLHQFGDGVADVVEDVLVPFHAGTGWEERGKRLDR